MENLIGDASGRLPHRPWAVQHVGPGYGSLRTSSGSHQRRFGQCLLKHPGQLEGDLPQQGAHRQPLLLMLQAEPEIMLGQRRLHTGWAKAAKTVPGLLELGTATSCEQSICQSSNTLDPCVTLLTKRSPGGHRNVLLPPKLTSPPCTTNSPVDPPLTAANSTCVFPTK